MNNNAKDVFRKSMAEKNYNPDFVESEIYFIENKGRLSNDLYFGNLYPDSNEFWEVENHVRPIKLGALQ